MSTPTLALALEASPRARAVPIPSEGVLVLGRDPACDVVFTDATVSRRHCEVFERDGRVWLRHLSGKNATYVNGRIVVGEVALAARDVLRLPVVEVRVVEVGVVADGGA